MLISSLLRNSFDGHCCICSFSEASLTCANGADMLRGLLSVWRSCAVPLMSPSSLSIRVWGSSSSGSDSFRCRSGCKCRDRCQALDCEDSASSHQQAHTNFSWYVPKYPDSGARWSCQYSRWAWPATWSKFRKSVYSYHSNSQKQLQIEIKCTNKANIITAIIWKRCEGLLGHLLDMA